MEQAIRKLMEALMLSEEQAQDWVRKSKDVSRFERIPGDASTRKYFRLEASGKSHILMQMEPFEALATNVPFLRMQQYLLSIGVAVPQVFDVDPRTGCVLLEDLGNDTLLHRLERVADAETERRWYERAIDLLVHLQLHGVYSTQTSSMEAFQLRFDEEKLMWEIDFTIEHLYEKHLKRVMFDKDRKLMASQFRSICKTLADEPTVLTHRDYHSRNIMVAEPEERLVMIDFQDARLGPAQYDLASLLKDSYYQLSADQVTKLIDYYIARREALSDVRIDRAQFKRIFDFMSVQRNFKAMGSFASFHNKRGIATYLKYIGNTFENIRRTLLQYPEYAELRELLFHYYYF